MPLNALDSLNGECEIQISQITKEDGISLYGFLDLKQKNMFDNLIKVSGIGAKIALALCSYFDYGDFLGVINANDFNALKKVPGIGEKMAKKIIFELSGKLENVALQNLSSPKQSALNALESLGFKSSEMLHLIQKIDSQNTQEIIKECLKSVKK